MPAAMDQSDLFVVDTPLGFEVRVSVSYWATMVTKHPDLANRVATVEAALRQPGEARRSRRDDSVYLICRSDEWRGRWVGAVTKRDGRDRFPITAIGPTRSRKENAYGQGEGVL